MIKLKTTRGAEVRVSRLVLEQLRMLMDWQIRARGYDPESVNLACCQLESS